MLKDYSEYKKYGIIFDFDNQEWCYVYELLDPVTKEIRYVGQARNIKRRKVEHLCPSRLKSTSHKNSWIKSLLKKNLTPIMRIVIATKNEKDLNSLEISHIKLLKSKGIKLLNHTEGGGGISGHKWGHHSKESKEKISLANKGKNKPKWTKELRIKNSKQVIGINIKTGEILEFINAKDAAKFTEVSLTRIYYVLTGRKKAKSSAGYIWKYKE